MIHWRASTSSNSRFRRSSSIVGILVTVMALSNFFSCNRCQASLSAAEGVSPPPLLSSIEHMKNFCYKLGICESIISKLISRSCSSNSRIISMLTLKMDFHPSYITTTKNKEKEWASSGEMKNWGNRHTYDYEIVPDSKEFPHVDTRGLVLHGLREERDEVARRKVRAIDTFFLQVTVQVR